MHIQAHKLLQSMGYNLGLIVWVNYCTQLAQIGHTVTPVRQDRIV